MPAAREALVAGFALITATLIVAIATVHDASIYTQSFTAAIIQKFEVTVAVLINVLGDNGVGVLKYSNGGTLAVCHTVHCTPSLAIFVIEEAHGCVLIHIAFHWRMAIRTNNEEQHLHEKAHHFIASMQIHICPHSGGA